MADTTTPPTTTTPVTTTPVAPVVDTPVEMTAADHLKEMGKIEQESGGFGNIGYNSPYWFHRSEYHRLTAK